MTDARPSLLPARPLRFVRSLWTCRRLGLSRRNVKALWAQSRVGWQLDWQMIDATDEEWGRFMEAMGE